MRGDSQGSEADDEDLTACILRKAHALFVSTPPDEVAAREIGAILAARPIRLVATIDRVFRDRGCHRRAGVAAFEPAREVLASCESSSEASVVLGLASTLRNGHVREAAVRHLDRHLDRLATAFLIMRLNDPVPQVSHVAHLAIRRRLVPAHAPAIVGCLPLVRRLSTWVRAGQSRIGQQIRDLLISDDPACRAALWNGTESRDSEVRREACTLLAAVLASTDDMASVLDRAFSDRDPATRRWAAEIAWTKATTPAAVRARLLPRMERDRSPAVRLVALRAASRAGDDDAIVRAVLDVNAEVRYFARKFLRRRKITVDVRARALELLHGKATRRHELIGALAALAELGRPDDLASIRPFTTDRRPSVAREARRTLSLLEA
jgi:hypothetical protein